MSRVDVLGILDAEIRGLPQLTEMLRFAGSRYGWGFDEKEAVSRLKAARAGVAEVFAAAHASLAARDLADQMAADDRLRAALAACEPETPHEPV
ncbi:TPA: hypothetical protein RNT04_001025 [Stenotrophomonas maltophilia]|uniref:hypothetical protein n=1 Tax=Stenotrophomonas maltophilia TaxID=40324 RepID=UPI001AAFBA98|nr:hypothetical protein [Stenotrophomonas maltophilia]MBO3002264.1 hypothetical protein [Stenotrophomonas maltophilia]MBP1381592.1 hypothetical protein [Stenotrophomonas maltophilia]MBP1386604.1 hypothetical protein [Stenotrophomonas maltophilia]HDX0788028.1 hypothetical protein [Stenotrophomonas maltophilia]HDX0806472.1 hypothetical protein [Stenotrophomonas maltophilia]